MNAALNALLILTACMLCCGSLLAQSDGLHYGLQYGLTLNPTTGRADVSLAVDDRVGGNIRSMRFHIDAKRHSNFQGDGTIKAEGDYVTWTPPETGGQLRFQVTVNNQRANGRFDARMTNDWAIFRGDDLFPPARTEGLDEAEADATLHVQLPKGWSFVAPYPEARDADDHVYEIEHAHRKFDRPIGWMAAGRLGVRRERIAGVRVVVAGPLEDGVRRLDMIALLNWNLPRARRLIPELPERLVVVSAGDPMWRGGLSGPNSLFVHADRPLLSENGSSTLIHELIHVITRLEGEKGGDWIVEGIAEYYSLKLMWRSGTLNDHRYKQAFLKLEEWGQEADRLDVDVARGPVTARAVGIMRKLDREIYKKTDRQKSLDEVVRLLVAARAKVNNERLRQAVVEVMGQPADALDESQLSERRVAGVEPTASAQ